MTPWEVIEGALGRRKPPRDQAWLAAQLGVSQQVVGHWKKRNVPASRYAQLADVLGLTMEQIAGRAPAPWETTTEWPFADVDPARWAKLTERQRWEIELRVKDMLRQFEDPSLGKSSDSHHRKNGTR